MSFSLRYLLPAILFTACLLALSHCKPVRALSNAGTVLLKLRRYDTATNQYTMPTVIPDMKVWYKDSMVIEEIKAVHIHTIDSVTTIDTPVAYYVFIDLPTRAFYHYSSFSDTATLIESYVQDDSLQIRGIGGWPFYRTIDLNIVGKPAPMKDTIMEGVRFNRMKFTQRNSGAPAELVGYFRCDRKGTFFQFHQNVGRQIGCPMVRTDFLPHSGNYFPASSEIIFVHDKLSHQEQKVFEAWKRNARTKPATW